MSPLKAGLFTVLSAASLFAAAPAQAHETRRETPRVVVRTTPVRYWYGGRWMRRPVVRFGYQPVVARPIAQPVYAQPTYAQPVYAQPIAQPVYAQPTYAQPVRQDDCGWFSQRINAELGQIEAQVRYRVAAGQLDGSALTLMESARDDIREDVVDVSAKGYVTDADRAHIENDLTQLRQKLGC